MGETHVDVTVRNLAQPHRCWEGSFLVDTGATDTQVPRRHLEAIGLEPVGSGVYVLADGSEADLDVTNAGIEFMGEILSGRIIYAESDAEPLLGLTALESAGLEVDPRNQALKRRRRRL
ncbi:MAG: clan AA aspartic protease [bacterium]|nr:clan AA aspartic protease [bacterium]MCY3924047.1 clan AA aspartic protease [bacterium]